MLRTPTEESSQSDSIQAVVYFCISFPEFACFCDQTLAAPLESSLATAYCLHDHPLPAGGIHQGVSCYSDEANSLVFVHDLVWSQHIIKWNADNDTLGSFETSRNLQWPEVRQFCA